MPGIKLPTFDTQGIVSQSALQLLDPDIDGTAFWPSVLPVSVKECDRLFAVIKLIITANKYLIYYV